MNETLVFEPVDDPAASIIVLAWREAPYLADCLSSVLRSVRRVPYELVLVLNEPAPSLLGTVERSVRGAVVVRSRVNLGYGGAVNLGVRQSCGRHIVLLNDDAEVEADWLEQLVETADRRPEAAAIGSTSLFHDGRIQEAGCIVWSDGSTVKAGRDLPGDSRRFDYERRVDFCSGSSLLVRREDWDALGGMDAETYYPAYYEDTDFCLRIATELHKEVWYQPRSRLRHHESAATNSAFRDFLFQRNQAILCDRWAELLATRDAPAPTDPVAIERAAWHASGSRKRLLLIDDQVADPTIGSGYPRMFETVSELVALGFDVVVFTSLVDGALRADGMARLGVQVLDGSFEDDLRAHLDGVFAPYDVALISRPHNYERFAPVIRSVAPDVPIVYDAEALFHRRIERQVALDTDPAEKAARQAEADAMRASEAAIAADADGLIAIFEEEAAFLAAHATVPVAVHGPVLRSVRPMTAEFSERADIAYIAGWAGGPASPNADAIAWFAREVMPRVLARVPGARLLVSGINPPEVARRHASHAIVFLGGVEDLSGLYGSIRVAVVPMRFGAGVKNKTIEALQYGVPTVSTTVGAEGVPVDQPDVLLVDDDPEGFAIKVATLIEDRETWELQRRRVLAQAERWQGEPSAWHEVLAGAIARGARRLSTR